MRQRKITEFVRQVYPAYFRILALGKHTYFSFADEYRQWLSRTPSTSAIYEQIRASRDVLNQQRAARFTYSAENIHDALKNVNFIYINQMFRSHLTMLSSRSNPDCIAVMVDPVLLLLWIDTFQGPNNLAYPHDHCQLNISQPQP